MSTSIQPLFIALLFDPDGVKTLGFSPDLAGGVKLIDIMQSSSKEKMVPNPRYANRASWVGHSRSLYVVLDQREPRLRIRKVRLDHAQQMVKTIHPDLAREAQKLPPLQS